VRDRKLEGIAALRDETDRSGLRIVVELKPGVIPNTVLNALFQKTNLQVTFGINMLGLVDDRPHILPLKKALAAFIEHRRHVITRRTEFDLDEANDRRHVLEGLKIALDNLDKVIALIRAAKTTDEAMAGLCERFGLTQVQARAILDTQLRRLASLERQKILDELVAVQKTVRELEAILASPKRVMGILKDELRDLKKKYGDERRTRILDGAATALPTSIDDLVPNEEAVVVLTADGFLKRLDGDPARVSKGVGGRDPVRQYLVCNQRATLIIFSAGGYCYSLPVHRVTAVARKSERGVAASALVELDPQDPVVGIVSVEPAAGENTYLVFATRQGQVKRTLAAEYVNARGAGIAALRLDAGDTLVAVDTGEGDGELLLSTTGGKAIRFREDEVRPTGRVAGGVRGVRLEGGDGVVAGPLVLPPGRAASAEVIVLTAKGFGKKTRLAEYPLQGRDGGGVRSIRLTERSGAVTAVLFGSGRAVTVECGDKDGKVAVLENTDLPVADRQSPGALVAPAGVAVACLRPRE
jgi:DNA gyrase subunit A